jgi:hypothetical protein
MGDLFRICIYILPKSERLRNVKAHEQILLLPAEYSGPGSQEECHGVMTMTMRCQLASLMLDEGVVITPPSPRRVVRRMSTEFCLGIVTQWRGGHFSFYLPATGCGTNSVFAT